VLCHLVIFVKVKKTIYSLIFNVRARTLHIYLLLICGIHAGRLDATYLFFCYKHSITSGVSDTFSDFVKIV